VTKVLQVIAGAAHGGAELFFVRLVLALHRAGVDQRVVMRPDADRARLLRDGGIEPIEVPFGSIMALKARKVLRAELKSYRPDIALTWMSRASWVMPKGAPVHAARLGGYYPLKYYRNCDHMIGNTRGIVDWLRREGWAAGQTHYLPNFVETRRQPAVDRAGLDTPADATVIVALGRLHDDKAFDVLIRALPAVPGAIVWLAGDGPKDAELKALAQAQGVADRVRWLGWRSDVPALCAAADILCCPSRIEPLGNVILEGWAQGLPVVACASAGPAELLVDGENGRLVAMEDHAALADALNSVIVDRSLRDHVVAGGTRTLNENFTEAAVVRAYLDFFDQVTRGRAAA